MNVDIQKGDIWKRISAWLFDSVMLLVLVTLFAMPLFAIFKYDDKLEAVESIEAEYKEQMKNDGLNPDITSEELDALGKEERAKYDAIDKKRSEDERLILGYSLIASTMMIGVTASILLASIILELIVPILFKNGQTLGKKVFGLAVMHTNSVKLRGQAHFVRSIIGKCAIETLVPVFFVLMIFFGRIGIVGVILLVLLLGLQLFSVISTKRTRSTIHDLISDTVVVDLASQKIFDTYDDLMEYKNRLHEEMVSKQDY